MPGNNSEISIPDCPQRWNLHGLPRTGALAKSIRLVFQPFATSAEIVSPFRLVSSGLGSNVST
jgi:hypothetical protein